MKVRCVNQIRERTGESIDQSAWLTIGRVYQVFEIHVDKVGTIKFRLISDDQSIPALHVATQFELVSGFIPSCWIIRFTPNANFKLIPKQWAEPGFWERYFDGAIDERRIFTSTCEAMIREEELGRRLVQE